MTIDQICKEIEYAESQGYPTEDLEIEFFTIDEHGQEVPLEDE